MTLTILYFAAVRDLVELDEERIDAPPDVTTARDLVAFLEGRHPALAGRLASVRVARNEVFASPGEVLADGDVIALIPPVAGG